jgi:hypothetical protein
MAEMSAAQIILAYDKAKADKAVWESTSEDLLYYAAPRKRGMQSQYTPGEKPPEDIFDDTAIQSNLILAAGLSGYMTNASQRWFELRSRDEALMTADGVGSFFNESQERMYSVFNNSNFYQQIHEVYIDLGSVGTAGCYEDDDLKETVRFYTRHPREIFIVEDAREEINMVFRKFQMTAYQAYQFFGADKCGKAIVKAVEDEKDFNKQFDFIHYVCPRNKRDPRKIDNKNKPFASYWVSLADRKTVREGGYEEFPYFCPRFYKNSGEAYGYSPAYTCFPSIKRLNNATSLYEAAAYQDAYPPWLMEHDGLMGTLDLRKDAINYQRQPLSQGAAVQSLKHDRNIQVGIDYMVRQEQKIQRAFFVDLFLMLSQAPNMTATEVIERTQEKMLILGPVLGRLQAELLNPIIYRTFNIMLRRGMLPQVPEALMGADWDVVYVSPLAKAQRAVQAKDMQTFLAIIGQMAQMAPSVLDKVDADKAVDKFAKVYSIDPDLIRSDDDVDATRQAQAQMQQNQMQIAAMAQGAMIAKDAGSATASFAKARPQEAK